MNALPTVRDRVVMMAEKPKHKWKKQKDFHPGGEKGKLHRELGISEDTKIPAGRLKSAAHSEDPEIRRDAIRAETMKKWRHGGHRKLRNKMYGEKD